MTPAVLVQCLNVQFQRVREFAVVHLAVDGLLDESDRLIVGAPRKRDRLQLDVLLGADFAFQESPLASTVLVSRVVHEEILVVPDDVEAGAESPG